VQAREAENLFNEITGGFFTNIDKRKLATNIYKYRKLLGNSANKTKKEPIQDILQLRH
jgi:hypothetical protein